MYRLLKSSVVAGLALALFALPAVAQDADTDKKKPDARKRGDRKGRRGGPNRAEILKKFDKDGDGKLSEEERKAAMEAMKKRRAGQMAKRIDAMFKRLDKNGDGKISGDEATGRAAKLIQRADGNGDGAVTKDELIEAIKKMRAKRGKRGGKGKRGQRGKRRGGPDGKKPAPPADPNAPI